MFGRRTKGIDLPRHITHFGTKSEPSLSGLSSEKHFFLIAIGLAQTTFPASVLLGSEFANYNTVINYSGLERRDTNGVVSVSRML